MNPANALSQLSPGMAECHARLMAVAKHGTTEAFSATLAGVLQRAELSISNAYDAGAASTHETMAVPTGTVRAGFSEGEIDAAILSSRDAFFANNPHLFRTEAFERFFTEAFALGAEYVRAAFSNQPDAQPAERMPSWMQYDKRYDILTIHGKRYSASMFGDDGFIAPAGTLLRVEAGDPDCVTLHKITAAQPVAQDGALGLLKFNDDMGASITGLPAMTIKPGDEFLIFPKSPAQPSSDGTADQWSKSEIDAAIKVNAPPCIEAVINPDVAATALRAYIKDCEAHAIVPDVGGAWHAAFLAGAASRGKAPAHLVTVEQVEDAIGLQSTAWDTIGAKKIVEAVLRLANGQTPAGATFQQRVQPWLLECFGAEIAADRTERNHRFFEESTELVQANGMTSSEAHQLVDYVFGRPVGDPPQEVGGVMVTLAALCLASGLDMHDAGEVELARINVPELVAKIRAKQAAKPKHSPLPEATTTQAAPAAGAVAGPVKWWNGCDKSVPAALRFLADHERPAGGESNYNSEHLYQLADEIERMASAPLYAAAPTPAAQAAESVPEGFVAVPVEVANLYDFMHTAFVPMTPQQEQIAISLELARKACGGKFIAAAAQQ